MNAYVAPATRGLAIDPLPTQGIVRVLGFAPLAGLDRLQAAAGAIAGPGLLVRCLPGLGVLLQAEPATPLLSRGRASLLSGLQTVQRRVEAGCLAGPFLPMDPAMACCPAGALEPLLTDAADGLAACLDRYGARHQWDVVLRWPGETVVAGHRADIAALTAANDDPDPATARTILAGAVAAVLRADRTRREAALLSALQPAVLAIAPGGPAAGETELAVTVMVAAGEEAALEMALLGMATEHMDDATVDLRGPLPPVSFAAVRLVLAEPDDVARAWRRLGLAGHVDGATLHRQWRRCAAAAHPDRNQSAITAATQDVSELTDAYRLLRGLLAATAKAGTTSAEGKGCTLHMLLRRAGHRLILPPLPQISSPQTQQSTSPELLLKPSLQAMSLETVS